jgi:hypothetical protein
MIEAIANDAGVEGKGAPLSTPYAQNVPVYNIRDDSLINKFMLSDTFTLYPLGVLTNQPISLAVQGEETIHWNQEKASGPLLPFWFLEYGFEYFYNLVGYEMTNDPNAKSHAHDAISWESSAMGQAGTAPPSPPPSLPSWYYDAFLAGWSNFP